MLASLQLLQQPNTVPLTPCPHTKQVGPGSYAVPESQGQPKGGPSAAFAWAGKWSSLPSAHQPAAEQQQEDSEGTPSRLPVRSWASSNASSSFSSATQRFVLDKESVAKPGCVSRSRAACQQVLASHTSTNITSATCLTSLLHAHTCPAQPWCLPKPPHPRAAAPLAHSSRRQEGAQQPAHDQRSTQRLPCPHAQPVPACSSSSSRLSPCGAAAFNAPQHTCPPSKLWV